MRRRKFLEGLSYFGLASLLPEFSWAYSQDVTRFAFGSCARQDFAQPIWNEIARLNPELFIFLGDNIYGDTEDMNVMSRKYEKLARIPEFANFRRKFPIIATWDDHDFGCNDSGAEYPMKEESKKLFLDFFGEPADSPRRKRPGVYTSYFIGREQGRRTQIILLDLRWARQNLCRDEDGNYTPSDQAGASQMDEQQWAWLEQELRKPADVRLIGSSLQVLSEEHRWEKWANFPEDRSRLFKMFDSLKLKNTFLLSGDMHFGELSMDTTPQGNKIIELTSSGLNQFEDGVHFPNRLRQQIFDEDANFGCVSINWRTHEVLLQVFDSTGRARIEHAVAFARELSL